MTSENVTDAESGEVPQSKAVDDRLLDELVGRAQAEGVQLTGEGGLLQQLTKRLLESALEGEITNHLGYDRHEPAGKNGGNSRNGPGRPAYDATPWLVRSTIDEKNSRTTSLR